MTTLPVIIWTDHKNLTYWASPQKVGPRAATWQVELTQYNYKLHHKPGDQNKANALSRRPDYHTENHANQHLIVLPFDCFIRMPPGLWENPTLNTHVGGLEETDNTILEDNLDAHVKISQDAHFSALLLWKDKYHLCLNHDNYFYYNDALVVVEDNSLRKGVLHTFHTSPTAGHPGISKTLALIQPHYWWPNMKDFVTTYIKGCATCQMNKLTPTPLVPHYFQLLQQVPCHSRPSLSTSSPNYHRPMAMTRYLPSQTMMSQKLAYSYLVKKPSTQKESLSSMQPMSSHTMESL